MKLLATTLSAILLSIGFYASAQTSIVFRNYVEDPDGDLNSETPPEASFAIWLDGDLDRILLDNAPRWEEDAEKAIPGNGSYNVELGN
ncbi:MAG: hypothetical protein GF419_00135, partial [Ignavibacteriales bacterium]|nr:hypothetical protein [Ignavibacteriales bacterium]